MLRSLLGALVLSLGWTAVGADEPEPTLIRVLVADQLESPVIEVTGRYRIINPDNRHMVTWGWLGKCYPVHARKKGLQWGEEFPGLYRMAIQLSDARGSVLVNGVQYRGAIVVYQVGDRISVVNEVPIDYYCKVVLAPKFKEPLAPEAMAAIAICERTHACWEAARHATRHFDVRADEVDYRGHAVTHAAPEVVAAVDNTRYMVLEQGACPGQAFPATWNEDCAGKTAAYEVVFRLAGIEGEGVEAPLAAHHRDQSAWKVAVPKHWLASVAQLDDIERINLYTDSFSHKVYAARLTDGEQSVDLDFATLQKVVGDERLLSNDFTVSVDGSQVVFSGHGLGHGVGLCLYSAGEMANRGQNAAEILSTFFPGSSLRIFEPESGKLPLLVRLAGKAS